MDVLVFPLNFFLSIVRNEIHINTEIKFINKLVSPSDYLNVKRIRRKRRLFIVIAAPINRLCQNGDTHGDIVHLSNVIA